MVFIFLVFFATRVVQLLSEETRSLSISIQNLQGVIFDMTGQRAAIDFVLNVVRSLLTRSQDPSHSSLPAS